MDTASHIFWITSRAAGITALVLASLSLGLGLAMSLRRTGAKDDSGVDYRNLHEVLSLLTLSMVALHGLSLLGDTFLRPGIGGIAIPFATPYRPLWTGLGIVAGYGLAALGLSYYARARIGVARWRKLHAFTAVFWVLGVVHSFGAGTDAWQAWFVLLIGAAVLPAAGLLVVRTARRADHGQDSRPELGPQIAPARGAR
jgi:sulfoxide reductase heme-binding subunit YedZ